MLLAGSGNQEIFDELLTFSKETTHEKIIRSLGLALASMWFGKED